MKKIAYMGLFGAVAIIFGYVESLFPVFAGIPGIKLGLANLVTVFILYTYSYREAALVSFIRILVIGFLFGNLFLFYSVWRERLSAWPVWSWRKISWTFHSRSKYCGRSYP